MISSSLQLFSWVISFLIGALYFYFYKYIIKVFNLKNIVLKIFIDTFYIIFVSFLITYTYYKVNLGYIHYSYIIFYILGYFCAFKVKMCVKVLKKTYFSRKS